MKILILVFCVFLTSTEAQDVVVGSKMFTESVVLGEVLSHLGRNAEASVVHRRGLGGTRVLWSALLKGNIDLYPEYTGTLSQEILAGENLNKEEEIRARLAKMGIVMSRPLGFNNTYALGMVEEQAEALGIRTISDLKKHPELVLGFGNEFMDRGDGWPSLRARYQLLHQNVSGLDHDLAYRGIEGGTIDVMDMYSTDAEIQYYGLRTLVDDLQHFPTYNAVIVYRANLIDNAPRVVNEILKLEGLILEKKMVGMNAKAKLEKIPEAQVAAAFLAKNLNMQVAVKRETAGAQLWKHTQDHLTLVGISLFAAILVAIPLGIVAFRWTNGGQIILGVVGIIQTIPSLALLVFMIPLLGIGGPPAIVALFLYSLLPIVRNTYAGLHDIPVTIRESAAALGLSEGAQLRLVTLPMASRSILAGIKISAVINVGTATLGALIGAGGYGQPILTGIRLDDMGLILQGAVPAALLALIVQGLFELFERLFVSRGLQLKGEVA
ncbi:MAG: ABC transporter permease subunit [Candidatus Latescibacteria bacterium]|jgi:osmoprotectant transport system permease protein|nr:ABC transporter permease subunit [Candidatus Latescibacterota bacterium]